MKPTNKVAIGALAGAITIVLVWIIKQVWHVDVPNEVAQAITVLTTFGTSYFVTNGTTDNETGEQA
jgi:putative flippase GtrA